MKVAAAAAWSLALACGSAPLAAASLLQRSASGFGAEPESSPVTKVVTLLKELKGRLEQDGTEEQKVYDKFACWCEETTGKKAASITSVKADLKSLGGKILQLKGTVATRVAEINELAKDIRENEAAQEMATAIRTKENTAYLAEEAELEQAIKALQGAIMVLRDSTASASLRQSRADVKKWSAALAKVHSTIQKLSPGSKPSPKHVVALSKMATDYTPQSATVQGILQDMYDSFTSTLQQLSSDEATKHTNFEDLMATYQKELALLQKTVVKKEAEKIEAETMLADGEVEYADYEKQLEADIKSFDATKDSCISKTDEWGARKSLRAEEIEGISKALSILTTDEAKQLFSKAITPGVASSFLQVGAADDPSSPVIRAQQTLKKHARMTQSLRLAALASDLSNTGHFDEVIVAIDTLLQQLATEEKSDRTKVDSCKEQFQEIDVKVNDLNWKIKNNKAKQAKLGKVVEEKEADRGTVVAKLGDVEDEITGLKGNRTEENGKYIADKGDDEKAIKLLQEAKEALEQYYSNHSIALGKLGNLLQTGREEPTFAGAKPEAKFSDQGKRKGESKGVIALLANIIEDLQAELAGGKKAEAEAQLDFERQLAAAEALQQDLNSTKIGLDKTISLRKADIKTEGDLQKDSEKELGTQNSTRDDITPSCEFYMGNLEERRRKRGLEAEGLKQAKEFLAGYRPPSMLQRKRSWSSSKRRRGLDQIDFAAVA